MDVVSREEFEAVKAMAAKARDEQETLLRRIDALESELAELKTTKEPASRPESDPA
jgi:BMFP domain-containing protein YqiC